MLLPFYIIDTIEYNGMEVIDLAFMPVNKQDIGFKGDLYILNDSTYAVVKADFGISEKINLNFVQDLKLVQEFSQQDSAWILAKDQVVADIALSKGSTGFFGTRTVMYRNYIFNQAGKMPCTTARKTSSKTKASTSGTVFLGKSPPRKTF